MSTASVNPMLRSQSLSQDTLSLSGASSIAIEPRSSNDVRSQSATQQREASAAGSGVPMVKQDPGREVGKGDGKKAADTSKHSKAIAISLQRLTDAKLGKGDLKMLLLCEIKVSDQDISALAPSVKASTGLRSLSLFGSGLTAAAAKMLANALASHESLTMLDLGNNALGSKGVDDVSNALIHNASLLSLGMAQTDMQDQGATSVSHVLRMNMSLTEVYLNSNGITQVGAQELAGALLFNDSSRLSKLFLFNNPLSEVGVNEFVKLIKDVPQVQERIALSEEKALAFAMILDKRLGQNSKLWPWLQHTHDQPHNLEKLPTHEKAGVSKEAQLEKVKRKLLTSEQLILKIIRLCHHFRLVERRIEGDAFPNATSKAPK